MRTLTLYWIDDNRATVVPPGGSVDEVPADELTVTVSDFVSDWPEVVVKLEEAEADPPKALMPTSIFQPAVNDVLLENVHEVVFATVLSMSALISIRYLFLFINSSFPTMIEFEVLETIELFTGVIINVVCCVSYLLKRSGQEHLGRARP